MRYKIFVRHRAVNIKRYMNSFWTVFDEMQNKMVKSEVKYQSKFTNFLSTISINYCKLHAVLWIRPWIFEYITFIRWILNFFVSQKVGLI